MHSPWLNRLAPILLSLASVTFAQSKPAIPPHMAGYDTIPIADGVYAFQSLAGGEAIVTGNSLVVIGDDGVLVVDSGHLPSLTARQIGQIRQWTSKPVRYLVNTHWHPDHNAGNGAYRAAFPDVRIVSTAATRTAIGETLPRKELTEQQVTQYAAIARTCIGPDGKPIDESARPYFEKVSLEMEAFLPELKAAQHLQPDVTFDRELSVFLGKREVRILFLGRGNTAGDAVVYVPDARVVATGDLLVSPVPYPFGSFIGEWIDTLTKVNDLDATVIVPGHGPVMRDKSFLQRTIALLQETKRQTDDGAKQGLSLSETRKKIDVGALRAQFVGDDKARAFFFDHGFLDTAVRRAYREAKEGPLKDED